MSTVATSPAPPARVAARRGPYAGLVCLQDFASSADAILPADVRDYVAGGSGSELTLRANRSAFDRIQIVPRVLTGAARADLATRLLGVDVDMPVAMAPMAYQRLLHPDGEVGTARAARDAGVVFVASMLSSRTIEDIAATAAATWLQLYWLHDRRVVGELVTRAESAGCRAIMLTVDVPRMGRRLRDIRRGFVLPEHVVAANLPPEIAAPAHDAKADASALMVHTSRAFDPALTWLDVDWLRRRTQLPIVLKGVMHPDDALRAVELGIDALVVSNHGGRQLDGAAASITALPAISAAVRGRCELYLDSGVRAGTDVLKALALGASGILLGRPALWGLAVGGQAGTAAVLSLLRTEIEDAMTLAGCPDVAAASRTTLVSAPAADLITGSG